jgi:hypothetical protein
LGRDKSRATDGRIRKVVRVRVSRTPAKLVRAWAGHGIFVLRNLTEL